MDQRINKMDEETQERHRKKITSLFGNLWIFIDEEKIIRNFSHMNKFAKKHESALESIVTISHICIVKSALNSKGIQTKK